MFIRKVFSVFLATLFVVAAQNKLPLYEKITYGKLFNGLTYYILPNEEPSNRAELFLAVNAGSVLEDDDQQGLAHFVEHMAFNGSKHFKKNELVEFLQSVGVKFGADLNAYTSFDETVYMIHIPTNDKKAVDKGFQVLEDWAHLLTFDPEEVDKERNVVLEEWRLGQGPTERVQRKIVPKIYAGSKYAKRLPIGKPEIIKTAPRETLMRFYKDWYRPDLMAVIVVGDIDPKVAEAKIKKHFAKIKSPKNPRKREHYKLPDNKEPIVALAKDKEYPFTYISIKIKQPKRIIKTEEDYKKVIIDELIENVIDERLNPYLEEAKYSLLGGSVGYGGFIGDKDALSIFIMPMDKDIEKAFKTVFGEAVKAYQKGFTKSELERAKKELLRDYEQKLKEQNTTESRRLVWNLVGHFLDNKPYPGPKYDYEFAKKVIKEITPEDLHNQYKSYWKQDNRVIQFVATEKENVKYPSEEDLLAWMQEVENKNFADLEEKEAIKNLLDKELPEAISVVKKDELKDLGITKVVFSNGLTAYLKPTDFKKDEILITLFSKGGRSLLNPEYDEEVRAYYNTLTALGVNNLSPSELDKILIGKKIRVEFNINDYTEQIQIKTAPKDLETALQLTYLYYTEPNFNEEHIKTTIMREMTFVENLTKMPSMYYYEYLDKDFYGSHPRKSSFLDAEKLRKANPGDLKTIHYDRFNNIGDFQLVAVGNFDVDTMITFIKKYFGNLPANNKRENFKDMKIEPVKGEVKHVLHKGTAEKARTTMIYHKEMPLPLKNRLYAQIFARILSMRLVKKVREENSLVYSISSFTSSKKLPKDYLSLRIVFPSAPENIDTIITLVNKEINDLLQNGANTEELQKAKKQIINDFVEAEERNNSWKYHIYYSLLYNEPLENIYTRKQIVENAQWEDIHKFMQDFMKDANYYELRMLPEEK